MKKLIILLTMLFISTIGYSQSLSTLLYLMSGGEGPNFTVPVTIKSSAPQLTVGESGGISGQINFVASDNDQINLTITTNDQLDLNGGNFTLDAGAILFFDDGGHTSISEVANDLLRITVGGVTFMEFSEAASDVLIINELGVDVDFIVESNNEDSMMVGDGATGIVSFEAGINAAKINFGADAQGSDAYVVSIPGVKLVTGLMVIFTANTANTDGATLAVNGYAAKNLTITTGGTVNVALTTNDILAGQVVMCVYDGTQFQVISNLN